MNNLTIITGASSGIGQALCSLLSNQNHKILAISRNQERIQKHQNIIPFQANLSKEQDIQEIVNFIGINSQVKYLIHSAGICGSQEKLSNQNYQEINDIIKVNLIAPIFLNNLLIKKNKFLGILFQKKDRSRILNVSSQAAYDPITELQSYSVTKAGLDMSKRAQQKELAQKGIFLSSVRPGMVDTAMFKQIFPQVTDEIQKDLIQPETVAHFLQYLIGNQITDQEFIDQDWNIYMRFHHKYWLKEGQHVPLVPPKIFK